MPIKFSPETWHTRFLQQARWTRDLRQHLYQRLGLSQAGSVLEVGCGTGALLEELSYLVSGFVCGLDIEPSFAKMAMRNAPRARLVQGDAHALPFPSHTFDLALCHFLLLWVHDPLQVVREMRRVVRSGGAVLALAEPDYGGRIDHPPPLAALGEMQRQALQRQGADPFIGRRLGELFHQAGLNEIEVGLLGGQWSIPPSPQEWEMEWQVLQADLEHLPQFSGDLEGLKRLEAQAWRDGSRILFVPTFYAWGMVPE